MVLVFNNWLVKSAQFWATDTKYSYLYLHPFRTTSTPSFFIHPICSPHSTYSKERERERKRKKSPSLHFGGSVATGVCWLNNRWTRKQAKIERKHTSSKQTNWRACSKISRWCLVYRWRTTKGAYRRTKTQRRNIKTWRNKSKTTQSIHVYSNITPVRSDQLAHLYSTRVRNPPTTCGSGRV